MRLIVGFQKNEAIDPNASGTIIILAVKAHVDNYSSSAKIRVIAFKSTLNNYTPADFKTHADAALLSTLPPSPPTTRAMTAP
jgi:hypothetical protein